MDKQTNTKIVSMSGQGKQIKRAYGASTIDVGRLPMDAATSNKIKTNIVKVRGKFTMKKGEKIVVMTIHNISIRQNITDSNIAGIHPTKKILRTNKIAKRIPAIIQRIGSKTMDNKDSQNKIHIYVGMVIGKNINKHKSNGENIIVSMPDKHILQSIMDVMILHPNVDSKGNAIIIKNVTDRIVTVRLHHPAIAIEHPDSPAGPIPPRKQSRVCSTTIRIDIVIGKFIAETGNVKIDRHTQQHSTVKDIMEPHTAIITPKGVKIKNQLSICRMPDRGTDKVKVNKIAAIP